MQDREPFFNPSDFHSRELSVSFSNSTTGTQPPPKSCSVVELQEKALVLELPSKSCSYGHHAILDIFVSDGPAEPRKILSVTGKVTELEEVFSQGESGVERSLRANFDCIQFDEKSWNELLEIYATRQDEISNFLKAAKGY